MNKQQLANKIWESANKMRSKIEANEYKDYILGFIFYKYLSDYQTAWLKKEQEMTDEDMTSLTEDDEETVNYIRQEIGYFISYDYLYSTWLKKGSDFNVSDVTDALSAFNRLISPNHKHVFEHIFHTLETGLSKLGESSGARTKAISQLLHLIKDIPTDGKQDYDVLGFIYEYLISMFAANAGKKAGEFYTPHEVSLLMSEIVANHLKDKEEIKIYDPTSGSGSLLINIGQSLSKYLKAENKIKYYAQELKENTYNLTRMNLIMRGIHPSNIVTRNADTLEDDWPYFDDSDPTNTYDPLYVDAVVSNPPYSQAWDPSNKEFDPRYKEFGLAPKGKADYAFLLHDLFHVKSNGIMTIVLPHGVLFRGGEEGTIRKNLIERNHIDAIIGLPANIFFGTGIPTIIMVLKQKRTDTDILIIDASKGFIKEGKNNKLRACDIKRISDTIAKRETIPNYSRLVTKDELRENDYNLNISRYVDSSKPTTSWDIYASMFGGIPESEVDMLHDYWSAFPTLKQYLFSHDHAPYMTMATDNIKEFIHNHTDIVQFKETFANSFDGFSEYLEQLLIHNIPELIVSQTEDVISDSIFQRLESIPLVDKYEAYQLFFDDWNTIASDLEILKTEGFEATKKVIPNIILKKKDGKEQEIQDGWVGHIIPFELVWNTLLSSEYTSLKDLENQLSEIPSKYEELIDSMTEDEKDSEVLNDSNDSFVPKEVTKVLKELSKEDSTDELASFISKLKQADFLIKKEKELKTTIKNETAKLHLLTKETIEKLSDEQAQMLLKEKWITGLISNLNKLPDSIINNLVRKVEELQKKYDTTLLDLEKEIQETEALLCEMIDELEGNEFDKKGLSEFQLLLRGK